MVERDLFLEDFRNLFDETDINEIQFDTQFKELYEWSSLMVLSLIVQFEDNYNLKLTPNQISESITVEDLYKLL